MRLECVLIDSCLKNGDYYFLTSVNFSTGAVYLLGISQIEKGIPSEAMSDPKSDVVMTDSECGPSEEPVIESSLRGKAATVDLDKHNGKQTSESVYHSPRISTRQHGFKSKDQLDKTDPIPLQKNSGPRSSQERVDISILKSSLLATEQSLEESLKKTQTKADSIFRLEKKLSQSSTSLEATKSKFEESQSRCKELQIQIEALREELKETREQVFRLQPLRENITQSDALREYIALCHSVKSWIGLRLDSALNTGSINVAKMHTASARNLIYLLTKSGLDGTLYPDTDEHNIIAIVMEFLRTKIFETELYGAPECQDLEFIYQIQNNMKNFVPRRGRSTFQPCKRLHILLIMERFCKSPFLAQRDTRRFSPFSGL